MKKFNFKTICSKIGASKDYGYSVSEIITLMVMFPLMLLQSVHALYKSEYKNLTTMKKECAAKSNGATRRKECKTKKNINAIILLKRAIKNGFIAKYVLVDSWFGGKEFIKAVREIKNGAIHVICGIRKDKRNYLYDGCIMNAKQLIIFSLLSPD